MVNPNQADSQIDQQKSSPRAVHPGRDGEASAGDRLGERASKPPPVKPEAKEDQKTPQLKDKPRTDSRGLDF